MKSTRFLSQFRSRVGPRVDSRVDSQIPPQSQPAGARWRVLFAVRFVACFIACWCVLALLAAPSAMARGALAGGVSLGELPREARSTYELIHRGGPFPYPKDGVTFGNYEGVLPKQRRGYYHEYTVPTPGARTRGARRIVCGGSPEQWSGKRPAACYYTDDHYASFRQIRE